MMKKRAPLGGGSRAARDTVAEMAKFEHNEIKRSAVGPVQRIEEMVQPTASGRATSGLLETRTRHNFLASRNERPQQLQLVVKD
jgi:hypothetical protein